MDEETSLSALREQLAQHEKDKEELQAAMFADPSDEELPSLVAELDEAIGLVRDLVALQQQQEQPAQSQEQHQPPPPPPPTADSHLAHAIAEEKSALAANSSNHTTSETAAAPIVTATCSLPAAAPSTSATASANRAVAVLPSVQHASLLLPWAEGDECEVKWASDGQWYRAVVESIDATTATVRYVEYDTHDAVPLTHLRALPLAEKRKRQADSSKVEAKIEYEEVSIPDSLRIQPEDDEATRAKKKKRAHAIEWRNRKAKVEVAHNQRQNAWQQFQSGGVKKKKKKKSMKGLAGLPGRKKSIFATSDSYSARVGVTGSGQGMTKNPEQRLKFSRSGELQNR